MTTTSPSRPSSAPTHPSGDAIDLAVVDRRSPTARLLTASAAIGPVLLLSSSIAWMAGDDLAELRGTLQFWAIPFLVLGLVGIASRLERPAPTARAAITCLLAIGGAAGASFANEILVVDQFDVERLMHQDTPSALLALGLPGLCMPFSIVLTGLLSRVHRTLPATRAALLVAGGVLFPMSRIPAIAELAVVADLVLVAAIVPVWWSSRSGRTLAA